MSTPQRIADAWVIQQFHDTFINKYENVEKLAGTTMEVRNVVGDTYKVPILDGAEMQERGAYGSLIPATLLDHTRRNITLEEFILNIPVDKGEQQLTNVDERTQLATTHAQAMGRRKDEWKLDALIAESKEVGFENIIPADSKNLVVDKLIEAKKIFVDQNVPDDDIFIIIGASQLGSLLKEQEVTSSDYNTVKALVNGDINTFMGFKFIKFGKARRGVGGLPITGNIRSCFAWHKSAVFAAFGRDEFDGFWWSGERDSWLSKSALSGGAKVMLPEGIIEIECDETA